VIEILRIDERTPSDVARSIQRRACSPASLRSGGTVPVGAFVRLVRGVYVSAEDWVRLDGRDRHRARVAAVSPMLGPDRVVSHASAAALHGWPMLHESGDRVDVAKFERTRADRRGKALIVHPRTPGPVVRVRLLDQIVPVTAPEVAAADLARSTSLRDAVVPLDHALRIGLRREAIRAVLDAGRDRGHTRAVTALDLADPRSDSVGESLARVVLHEIGAPTPVLQHRFRSARGEEAFVDFWFPDAGVVVEFDGEVKYRDPEFLRGRSSQQVVIDEKYREDWIRRDPSVRSFIRLRWAELWHPTAVAAKLWAAGLVLRG
jgi:hypothetical protein